MGVFSVTSALVFGVYIRAPDFENSHVEYITLDAPYLGVFWRVCLAVVADT